MKFRIAHSQYDCGWVADCLDSLPGKPSNLYAFGTTKEEATQKLTALLTARLAEEDVQEIDVLVPERVPRALTMWLKCELTKGMLGDELAVEVETVEGKRSLFTASNKVRHSAGATVGQIQVSVLDRDSQYGLVMLPSGSLEDSSVVKVERRYLSDIMPEDGGETHEG